MKIGVISDTHNPSVGELPPPEVATAFHGVDVIIHAGSIYLNCLKLSGAKKMVVPQVGLPDGIINQLYKDYKIQLG